MDVNYTCEVTIAQTVARVIELFDNPDNMRHWQPGFVSFEPVSRIQGQVGAKARLKYKMGRREVEMIETITERRLPERFAGAYEADGVYNVVANRFEAVSPTSTRWVLETEFRFSGFMKIIGWLMPGAFKKETRQFMEHFKAFAEQSTSVAAVRAK